jgi:hypothetical protein
LDLLLQRTLDMDPTRRPDSAGAYARELTAILDGTLRRRRDIPTAWVAGVAAVSAVGAGVVGWLLR